jgi:hypothetical protein
MQNVSFRCTRWNTRCHRRFGHLFQSRHHAIVVDADSYVLKLDELCLPHSRVGSAWSQALGRITSHLSSNRPRHTGTSVSGE